MGLGDWIEVIGITISTAVGVTAILVAVAVANRSDQRRAAHAYQDSTFERLLALLDTVLELVREALEYITGSGAGAGTGTARGRKPGAGPSGPDNGGPGGGPRPTPKPQPSMGGAEATAASEAHRPRQAAEAEPAIILATESTVAPIYAPAPARVPQPAPAPWPSPAQKPVSASTLRTPARRPVTEPAQDPAPAASAWPRRAVSRTPSLSDRLKREREALHAPSRTPLGSDWLKPRPNYFTSEQPQYVEVSRRPQPAPRQPAPRQQPTSERPTVPC